MRTRSLLTLALTMIGVLTLFLVLSDVALTQDASRNFRPTATPAPLPPGYERSSPASPDAMPDLIVDSIVFSPPDPYVDQDVAIYVTIKNVGTEDVDELTSFFLDLYINPPTDDLRGMPGDVYWDVQGALMKVGQSATFTAIFTDVFTDTVSYNVWAQVDTPTLYPPDPHPNGFVLESDEDNNILGPEYVTVRTHQSWVQQDHVEFFGQSMASTLDVVPADTVDIIPPGLEVKGDSALALGVFDEPPRTTWGSSSNSDDYNMMDPDTQVNLGEDEYQRYPYVHAQKIGPGDDDELVVVVWEDGRNGPTYGKDIFMRWSTDGGQSWEPGSEDYQVNETYDPPGPDPSHAINDQKHPAVAVSPDGHIVVTWQDHRGASFDLYVQVFFYDGANIIRCDPNGDCAADCDAETQECNRRVDTDAIGENQILPDIAVDGENNFYVVWQDQRNGNDDIFAVRSYTSTAPCPLTTQGLGFFPQSANAPNLSPDYLCWGQDARIHDDPTTTKQASPSVAALDGVRIVDFEWEFSVISLDPLIVDVWITEITTTTASYVTVAWEDWREGDADIYLTYSEDGGRTFVVDTRLNDDKPPNTTNGLDQRAPAVAVNQWMKWLTLVFPTPYGDIPGEVRMPVTTMHAAWQDFRNSTVPGSNDNPDIYYQAMTVQPDAYTPWPLVFEMEGSQWQVNDNDERAWQEEPVWQGEPDIAATGSGLVLEESRGYNAYVIWSDGRNYGGDFDNLDVYFRLISNVGEPSAFVGGNNISVNSGARLHDFNPDIYDDYRQDTPPHARQRNPSIAATLVADWPLVYWGYVYVVWDDDRPQDPFVDRNIAMSRSNLMFGGHRRDYKPPPSVPGEVDRYGSGAYVSEVYCTPAFATTWYIVDWHAVRDSGTYLTLQTRLGDSRADVLSGEWYPERYPYPDDVFGPGAPLQGYDAPGQHIEDENGDYWPQARCIQYRLNFWARDAAEDPDVTVLNTPFLFDVILHYELPPMAYLPLVFKNYPAP